jgi:hypothetical protein
MDVGKKLEINKDFNGIAEVIGIYPRGQTRSGMNEYEIMIDGQKIRLAEDVISIIFKEVICK